MRLIGTNVILRYVLEDNEEMFAEAERVIDDGAFVLPEVIAEVVYVLVKVYKLGKQMCAVRSGIYWVTLTSSVLTVL